MKTPTILPENHHRALSVAARMVAQTLDEMENLLRAQGNATATSLVESTYSDEERERLLAAISRMRKANEEMFQALGLQPSLYSEEQIILAKTTHLWTILEDSRPQRLKGFGSIPADAAAHIERHVQQLLNLLNDIRLPASE